MPHRLSGMPPFGLLPRVLGADSSTLTDVARVTIDTNSLLQLIALAALAAEKAQSELSAADQAYLDQYFAGAAAPEFEVDEALYLEINPDVAAAIDQDPSLTAQTHFTRFGLSDGRAPNASTRPLFKGWLEGEIIQWKQALPPPSSMTPTVDRQVATLMKKTGVDFMQALETLPYFRAPATHGQRSEFATRLAASAPELADRERVVTLSWLAANRDHALLEAVLPSVMEIDERILPSAVKAMVEYSRDTGRAVPEKDQLLGRFFASTPLQAFLSGDQNSFIDTLVRGHAASLAAHFMPSSSPRLPETAKHKPVDAMRRHVFLGFFGQMRFADRTVPALLERVRNAVPDTLLSVGFSTWDRSGVRVLDDQDPIYFAMEQLPPPFLQYCENAHLSSVRDFEDHFPSICGLLKERGRTHRSVNATTIKDLCGHDVLTDISDDESFISGPGKKILSVFPEQSFMLNQGRMWNRIAALGPLLADAETTCGPVTDVILMRPDLKIAGSLDPLFEAMALSSEALAYVDYDAHATFLDGVGDRIFLTKPNIARRLFDGERVMQSVVADPDTLLETYRWFLVPHRFPQTLLFEHGAHIHQADHELIKMHIFRGQMEMGEICEAIQRDHDCTVNPTTRNFLARLLPG